MIHVCCCFVVFSLCDVRRYFLENSCGWILELDRGEGIPHEGRSLLVGERVGWLAGFEIFVFMFSFETVYVTMMAVLSEHWRWIDLLYVYIRMCAWLIGE